MILLTLKVYFNYILCNDSSVLEDSKGSLSHLCLDFPPKEVFNCWNSNLATRLCQFFIEIFNFIYVALHNYAAKRPHPIESARYIRGYSESHVSGLLTPHTFLGG